MFKFCFTIDSIKQSIEHFRETDYKRVNLVLFNTINTQFKLLNKWSIINLLANSVPFYIYGILFKATFKYKFISFFIVNFLLILCIEITQYKFVIGTFDVDDILLNITFASLGFLTYFLCLELIQKNKIKM